MSSSIASLSTCFATLSKSVPTTCFSIERVGCMRQGEDEYFCVETEKPANPVKHLATLIRLLLHLVEGQPLQ